MAINRKNSVLMANRLFKYTGVFMLVAMNVHVFSARVPLLLDQQANIADTLTQTGAENRSGSNTPLCHSPACVLQSSTKTVSLYGNLFLSEEELQKLTATFQAVRTDSLKDQGYISAESFGHDGDSCCATRVFYAKNDSMLDVFETPRSIVHFNTSHPPAFQHIPFAECVTNPSSACTGRCFIEPSYLNLLVYDRGSPTGVTFAWFSVPGYCSCKNVKT